MKIFVAVWAFVGLLLTGTVATAQPAKPTIVLVHGAFADSSSWYGVIAILERDGYSVVAAANPLRSVKGDADTVRALLASINTPVVLVGHSYGGMVISNAANGQANVKALVYVAAFAPEAGENAGGLNSKFPGSLVGPALAPPVPLPGGGHDLYVQQEKFHDAFAPDVPADAARLAAAAQRPVTDIAFSEPPPSRPGRPSRLGSCTAIATPRFHRSCMPSWPSALARARRQLSRELRMS